MTRLAQMDKRSGFSLIVVLWFAGLTLTLMLASAVIADGLRSRVQHSKMQQAAAASAVSGLDFAQAMVRWGRWRGGEHYTSPDLGGTGRFTVSLSRSPQGLRIHSIGLAGDVSETADRVVP